MISVVCVYNDERTLESVLLKSLRNQTASFELVTINNTAGQYRSAAEALNHGGAAAKGDYIMFVHQDIWLGTNTWLDDAQRLLASIPQLGVAGVCGASEGRDWQGTRWFSIDACDWVVSPRLRAVDRAEQVQTLDECLLIVPREVFAKLQFDAQTFDGWDSYAADYCLSVARFGLESYVIPLPGSHSTRRRTDRFWEYRSLLKYQKRLYRKHGRNHHDIYTWMERVSPSTLVLHQLLQSVGPIFLRLFPDSDVRLGRELDGCQSVLDLGCGSQSPVGRLGLHYSVGVDMFGPSLQESRRRRLHAEYIEADVRTVQFKPQSFDAVIALQVIEHLTKEEGLALLKRMEGWAKTKVVVTTHNGYVEQHEYGNNPLQEHKSGWDAGQLRQLGFRVRGDSGWKGLLGYRGQVKYRPVYLWERISDVTQRITWHFPDRAFRLLAVKRLGGRR